MDYIKITEYLVDIDYTNWKGVRSIRRIKPQDIYWLSNEYHPELQWVLEALDIEKGLTRLFAMKDIHSWTPVKD